MKTAVAGDIIHSRADDGYEAFLESIRRDFAEALEDSPPLFSTNASGLFPTFLDNLPDDARQHYTCNACRQFVERYGGLVTIAPDGETTPVFWSLRRDVPAFFRRAVVALNRAVSDARVTGVFFYDRQVWGQPVTGDWHHMAVMPDTAYSNALMTPAQHMAEKREDFKTLITALHDFPIDVVRQAVNLLRSDTLYRSEKVLGVAEWLYGLHLSRQETKNAKLRHNMTWLAVYKAPAGFCHVRSTMIGTLLEDIAAGRSFDTIKSRFEAKMNPTRYQRPQAAPTAGNIKQAEAVVSKLGIERALERRFARLEELPLIWKPQPPALSVNGGNGVFSHLQPKGTNKMQEIVPHSVIMTWEKFSRQVLPNAAAIEFLTGHDQKHYAAILTAVHEDTPPIIQWDRPERRNPFSWYVYSGGSLAKDWNLAAGVYVPVTGICLQPSMWQPGFDHHGKSIFLLLEGARDSHVNGLCLFPEILRSDLHGIRATIEAYSKSGKPSGQDTATACGIRLQSGIPMSITLLVTTDIGKQVYVIDRWD